MEWVMNPGVPLSEWFRVSFHDKEILLDVRPPGRTPWEAEVRWDKIIRIAFKTAESFMDCDEIYIFTSERPESYLIPMEASGALELWNEMIKRGLFSAELAVKAASTCGRLFVWPPVDPEEEAKKEAKPPEKKEEAPKKKADDETMEAISKVREEIGKAEEAKDRIVSLFERTYKDDDGRRNIQTGDAKEAYYSIVAAWEMLRSVSDGNLDHAKSCRGFIFGARDRLGQTLSELEVIKDAEAKELHSKFGLACERALNAIEDLLKKMLPTEEIKAPAKRVVIKGPEEIELLCEVCGKVSMTFKKGVIVKTEGFIFTGITKRAHLDENKKEELLELLRKDDIATAHKMVMDMGWATEDGLDGYCPECDKVYCRDHIHTQVIWDDGFYDYTYGTCPMGHKRIIDD
jgi:hypothetical protein